MANDWIKLVRDIKYHWIYSDPRYFQWWFCLLCLANWRDTKTKICGKPFLIERGQVAISLRQLRDEWEYGDANSGTTKKPSLTTVRNFLKKLEEDEMIKIDTQNLPRGETVITICKYEDYQGNSRDQKTDKDTNSVTEGVSEGVTESVTKTVTSNKNNKEIKEEKEEKEIKQQQPCARVEPLPPPPIPATVEQIEAWLQGYISQRLSGSDYFGNEFAKKHNATCDELKTLATDAAGELIREKLNFYAESDFIRYLESRIINIKQRKNNIQSNGKPNPQAYYDRRSTDADAKGQKEWTSSV
ncbi:MAG: hypothetical protein LIP09_04865 [Bacteroidales bacterium]|nr:hypothetical protein [Bacteroidales bacterium]